MDARKLLSTINQGFSGQVSMMESKLNKLGTEFDRKFRLVSVNAGSLMFEDIKSNNYYRADYKMADHQISLSDIKQIIVVDEKKPEIFNKACSEIIEAIEDEDLSKADKIFNQIEKGYCTPKVIPESGIVKTRDGLIHKICVSSSIISESIFPVVVKVIKESIISSKITIKEGVVSYSDKNVKMPITKLTLRQVNARHMKNVAENAYKSENFGRLIKACAAHISNSNVRESVKLSKDFFAEEQEFTLLSKGEFKQLIENTLYSNGIFNHKIVDDTSAVLWETNCFVNKDSIIKEWKIAADDAKSKNLSNNVKLLEEVSANPKKFSEAYDSFIKSILVEDMSSKAVKAQAYLNMLKLVKNVVSGSDADAAVQGAVDDLVIRLESDINSIDDATLYEVEDLLATVGSDLISDVQTLGDFDKVPEPQAADAFGAPEDLEGDFAGDMGEDFTAPSMGGVGGDVGDIGGAGGDMGADVGAAGGDMGGAGGDIGAAGGAPADLGAEPAPGAEPIPVPGAEEEEEPVLDSKKTEGSVVAESDYKTPAIDDKLKVNESYGEGEKPWEKKDEKDEKDDKKDEKKVDDKEEKKVDEAKEKKEEKKEEKKAEEVKEEKKEKKEEKKVEESMIAVADTDDKLIELISAAMDADDKTGSDVEPKKDEGELIVDTEKKVEECDNPMVKEDNDITDPESKSFAGHQDDKKDHEGKKRNDPPKFSDEDYDGTGKAKTGKEKPDAGLPSATKE